MASSRPNQSDEGVQDFASPEPASDGAAVLGSIHSRQLRPDTLRDSRTPSIRLRRAPAPFPSLDDGAPELTGLAPSTTTFASAAASASNAAAQRRGRSRSEPQPPHLSSHSQIGSTNRRGRSPGAPGLSVVRENSATGPGPTINVISPDVASSGSAATERENQEVGSNMIDILDAVGTLVTISRSITNAEKILKCRR
jgi:hypothetical protein